ncbi:MAG: NapC/NirT family cytochrome c [Acidobacteriota bacterium]|jgi:cytochrome c nitrite reductase small subunit|nr:NapC/NirT family cytochrome c [Acidobacteriota bacterium]
MEQENRGTSGSGEDNLPPAATQAAAPPPHLPDQPDASGKKRPCRKTLCVGLAGIVAGVALVLTGSALLHGTDTASFCASCHSMDEAALTHRMSAHAAEDCNACHLPTGWSRLPAKASTGLHDILATLTGNVPPRIQASEGMKDVVNDNCIRCHRPTVENVDMTAKRRCTECHRAVPHMNKLPIAKRRAADV